MLSKRNLSILHKWRRSYCSNLEESIPDKKKIQPNFPKHIDDFPVYKIRGLERPSLPLLEPKRVLRRHDLRKISKTLGRYPEMPLGQDWTNVWPTATSFKWSVVPFPVRQGYVKPNENDGVPPIKYGNTELTKIPNFLHLTPKHIQKHCAAIKQFCTQWPPALNTDESIERHYPVETTTINYVYAGPDIRDPRSRVVTLKVKLSSMSLREHDRHKMIALAGDRYDRSTDTLTIKSDRCPLRKQNYEYTLYLLSVLYAESCKTEPWEAQRTPREDHKFIWRRNRGRENLFRAIRQAQTAHATDPTNSSTTDFIKNLPPDVTDEQLLATTPVKHLASAVARMVDHGGADVDWQYCSAIQTIFGVRGIVEPAAATPQRDAFRPVPTPPSHVATITAPGKACSLRTQEGLSDEELDQTWPWEYRK